MLDEVKSDFKMIVRVCYIEQVPIEESRFQQAIRAMGMEDAADRLSYEIELPGEDESCSNISNSSSKQLLIS